MALLIVLIPGFREGRRTFGNALRKSPQRENSFSEYVESSLPIIEELASEGALDYSVTLKELQMALLKSKNGKSAGPDLIGNEMIKYGGEHLHRSLLKDTLWVLRRDEPLVHVLVDISLIIKHILDYDISL